MSNPLNQPNNPNDKFAQLVANVTTNSANYQQIFSQKLLTWFAQHGRHDLPWQVKDDPYKVWVSEIMLQQTQVKTVLRYFDRFIVRFPTVQDLAKAEWDEVAPYWAGLGYYARARNLHKAARQLISQGSLPRDLDGWMALSGVGRSTAGALMSLGLGQFGVILDGNVKRVLSRFFAISGDLSSSKNDKLLWQLATALVPKTDHAVYTQAIMDLGATLCTPKKPLCMYCPMQTDCQAFAQDRVLDFPQKKVKKAVSIKHADVLIIEFEQQWLWYKRPEQGIWGGLHCLPIIEQSSEKTNDQKDEFKILIGKYNLQASDTVQIKHQFTHFTWLLNCHRFMVKADQVKQLQQQFSAQFYAIQDLESVAIPTAMQKVVNHFKMVYMD
ncbi:A/G-specific adenine glycosylase [Acinetobacter sp. A3.8]|uniref:Adenine DNA glycosylase n=1 Tax=Acinetobacter sedimenti TaxID=2919922 RepID=A0A9X1WV98_9GAMM|nr:A/G-specific adenine glycosylase [Acinetobacter sedimenti]MCJ8145605.1 A/G-specific adenine glycosylase [Acinetobacter sedimenti]